MDSSVSVDDFEPKSFHHHPNPKCSSPSVEVTVVPTVDLIDFGDSPRAGPNFNSSSSMFSSDNSLATVLDKSSMDHSALNDSSSERLFEGVGNGSLGFNNNNLLDSSMDTFSKTPSSANSSLNRKTKKISSSALASQLYHGRPGGSSTRSFNGDATSFLDDDLNSSVSDSEVLHRHHSASVGASEIHEICGQVQRLEEHLSAMQEHRLTVDEKYIRLKQENAVLLERMHNLDEQMSANDERWKQRLADEQRKLKDAAQRSERERQLELDAVTLKLQLAERECEAARQEARKAQRDASAAQEQRDQMRDDLREMKNMRNGSASTGSGDERRSAANERTWRSSVETAELRLREALGEIAELKHENDELRKRQSQLRSPMSTGSGSLGLTGNDAGSSSSDYELELRPLRDELRQLRDKNAELQAELLQISVEQGRRLLDENAPPSLADELHGLSKDQILNALKDQEIVNQKLRLYVDGILLKIMEHYPALLEIKSSKDDFI